MSVGTEAPRHGSGAGLAGPGAPGLSAAERLALVTQAVGAGVYEWEVGGNGLWVSPRLVELFGAVGRELTPARWTAAIHPDDAPRYRAALRDCFKGVTARLDCEYRVRHDDGADRWIEDRAVPVRDAEGRVVRLVGAIADVTPRKAAEAALHETLEQQTATAEVLQVINSTAGNLAPAFTTLLETATRLCDAAFAILWTCDGTCFTPAATHGLPPALAASLTGPMEAAGYPTLEAIVRGRNLVSVDDLADTEEYRLGSAPLRRALVDRGGVRTAIVLAIRPPGVDPVFGDPFLPLGAITLCRREVRPFTDKQITVLRRFATQAVIAIQNARLMTETREALEQQTATAEVLQVINSSPGDLAPVFDAMLEQATRLCGAAFGIINIYDGERLVPAATRGVPAAFEALLRSAPPAPGPQNVLSRLVQGDGTVRVDDGLLSAAYRSGDPRAKATVEVGGARSYLAAGLRKDGRLLGTLAVYRQEVRPFSDKQAALLQNFAAQAVIAMENARLLTETRERTQELEQALEYQTATSDVLRVISRSPVDITGVLDFVCDTAARLCQVQSGSIFRLDGDVYRFATGFGLTPEYRAAEERAVIAPGPGTLVGRVALAGKTVQIRDAMADPGYEAKDAFRLSQARTVLGVPLVRDGVVIGVICLARSAVEAFSDRQIDLVSTFADQAVIAIENTRLFDELRERTRDLELALEYQTAISDVLKVISRSTFDLEPVLDNVIDTAIRLCRASMGSIFRLQDGAYRWATGYGLDPVYREIEMHAVIEPGSGTLVGRVARDGHIVQITDSLSDPLYAVKHEASLTSARTMLGVPLLREGVPIGVLAMARDHVEPFTEKEIDLVRTFADQAVIAIENARLLGELRDRTRDLQESLEYQTATSDVLKVISQSTFDLNPVLEFVLETAMRLVGNSQGEIFRLENGVYRMAVSYGMDPAYREIEARQEISPGSDTLVGRTVLAAKPVEILDLLGEPGYAPKDDAQVGKIRTVLGVPLLREGVPIGVICTARTVVKRYTEKEIALVATFADQAVIAIENARLLGELRERTDDLQESLEYQTATSEVLKVISQSTFDLDPVLETVVGTAIRLCRADHAAIYRNVDGEYRWAIGEAVPQAYEDIERNVRIRPGAGTLVGRVALEGRTVHILDAWTDPAYKVTDDARTGGVHTLLGVPLLREGVPIGVIGLARQRVEAFTEKQIDLVATFADQAVIAIENARLFNALRERTDELARSVEELKALSEVGQAVSSTLDVGAVLSTILDRSVALAGADAGAMFRYRRAARAFRLFEAVGWDDARMDAVRGLSISESVTAMGEAIAARAPLQIADLAERPSNPLRDAAVAAGLRSSLIVPLAAADRVYGTIVLQRRAVGAFPGATVRLLQTLASQSVLAIQNARLFREIADKSEQLAEASRHKSQFLANMSHELRTPLNAILGYTELLAEGLYGELAPRAAGVLERVQNNGRHLLALINDVLDLSKIEAGQFVWTLEDYALGDVVQSVVSATEGLANSKGLKFTAEVAPGLPTGHGDSRRLSQVLLNLVGNAVKFTEAGEVAIGAAAEDGAFVVTVRDTGPGIAPEDHARIFGEFQQVDNSNTRKKGGTGLGLAISKRMVEMQGGAITVDSELGRGATFRVTLPIRVETVPEELMGAA